MRVIQLSMRAGLLGLTVCGVATPSQAAKVLDVLQPSPAYVAGFDGSQAMRPKHSAPSRPLSTDTARVVEKPQPQSEATNPNTERYRGYFFDLTAITDRRDFVGIVNNLRRQVDIVESAGLSQRVREFFRTVPIVMEEFACIGGMTPGASSEPMKPMLASACYEASVVPERSPDVSHGLALWDYERSRWVLPNSSVALVDGPGTGAVMVRPLRLGDQEPTLLHELLHAYHAKMMPQGFRNPAIRFYHEDAKGKQLYPANAYLVTNEKEFFAVTASVFLYGKGDKEPFTRSKIKEQQPDYYRYLVWLFGFEPDSTPSDVAQQLSQNVGWANITALASVYDQNGWLGRLPVAAHAQQASKTPAPEALQRGRDVATARLIDPVYAEVRVNP